VSDDAATKGYSDVDHPTSSAHTPSSSQQAFRWPGGVFPPTPAEPDDEEYREGPQLTPDVVKLSDIAEGPERLLKYHQPSPRRALTRALELAREAVELDSTNTDPSSAIRAYGASVALLSKVMERAMGGEHTLDNRRSGSNRNVVAREEEINRLKIIHDTYADRMNTLSLIYSTPLEAQQAGSTTSVLFNFEADMSVEKTNARPVSRVVATQEAEGITLGFQQLQFVSDMPHLHIPDRSQEALETQSFDTVNREHQGRGGGEDRRAP